MQGLFDEESWEGRHPHENRRGGVDLRQASDWARAQDTQRAVNSGLAALMESAQREIPKDLLDRLDSTPEETIAREIAGILKITKTADREVLSRL